MGPPAAKEDDHIVAVDIHLIQPPAPSPPVPVPHPFDGVLDGDLSSDVKIQGKKAATVGSTATNRPRHIPQGGSFVVPPRNQGRVLLGSLTVRINGKLAARAGDTAMTCNDPLDLPVGKVVAVSTVFIGG
jgi:uncharacterized Zn-binding protein involved in type VI secretion